MNRAESGDFDYEFYVEKNADVELKINKFLRAVPAVGDRANIANQLKQAIENGRKTDGYTQTRDSYIAGKVIHVHHHVDPRVNMRKEVYIYRINIFI